METGAYQWRNLVNGKVYVGWAYKSFEEREKFHRFGLNAGTHFNRHLQNAWLKYGADAFVFEVLERCAADKETIVATEQKWLDAINPTNPDIGYNLSPTANSTLGVKYSEETRQKISALARERGQSPGQIANLEKIHKERLGKPASTISKIRQSLALRGKVRTPETLERMRLAATGHKASAETRAKMSAAQKGRKATEEQKAAMKEAANRPEVLAKRIGKKLSEETRAKMSAAHKGKNRKKGSDGRFI